MINDLCLNPFWDISKEEELKVGHVVSLKEQDGKTILCKCKSNYDIPFGIISFLKKTEDGEQAIILFKREILSSLIYDTAWPYRINDPLFVNNGLLTTLAYSPYRSKVGMVIEPPSQLNNNTLKFLWL